MFDFIRKLLGKPFDVHQLPYALHLGNDKQMGFLAGTSNELRPRQGHNREEDMFYFQLTHYQTQDQMRVWLTMEQFEAHIANCQKILASYKREKESNPTKPEE